MDAETQAVVEKAWIVVHSFGAPRAHRSHLEKLKYALQAHAKAHPPELPKASETPPARQMVHFAHAIGDRVRINPFDKTHEALAAVGTICALTLWNNGSQRFSVYYPGRDPSGRLPDFGADELSPPGHYATTVNTAAPKHPPPPNETTTGPIPAAGNTGTSLKTVLEAAWVMVNCVFIPIANGSDQERRARLRKALVGFAVDEHSAPSPPAPQPTILQLEKGDVCVMRHKEGLSPGLKKLAIAAWRLCFPGVAIIAAEDIQILRPAKGSEDDG